MLPDPDDVLRELRPIIAALFTAVEDGVLLAQEFFGARQEVEEPHLYATLVRYQAKLAVDRSGQRVEFDREDLANNGLCLTFGRLKLKIQKATRGGVRGPGISRSKQAFFRQMTLFTIGDMEIVTPS